MERRSSFCSLLYLSLSPNDPHDHAHPYLGLQTRHLVPVVVVVWWWCVCVCVRERAAVRRERDRSKVSHRRARAQARKKPPDGCTQSGASPLLLIPSPPPHAPVEHVARILGPDVDGRHGGVEEGLFCSEREEEEEKRNGRGAAPVSLLYARGGTGGALLVAASRVDMRHVVVAGGAGWAGAGAAAATAAATGRAVCCSVCRCVVDVSVQDGTATGAAQCARAEGSRMRWVRRGVVGRAEWGWEREREGRGKRVRE